MFNIELPTAYVLTEDLMPLFTPAKEKFLACKGYFKDYLFPPYSKQLLDTFGHDQDAMEILSTLRKEDPKTLTMLNENPALLEILSRKSVHGSVLSAFSKLKPENRIEGLSTIASKQARLNT